MKAKLKIRNAPELHKGARQVTVDCKHGTTNAVWVNVPGGYQLSESQAIAMALAKHDSAESCHCTERLWMQYGPRVA